MIWEEGYFKNIHINMVKGDSKNFAINFKPENHSLSLDLENFLGQITMDWELCGLTYICLWGSAEVNLKNKGFHLNGDLDLTPVKHANGKMLPLLHLDNFGAQLSADDLEISIFNSFNGEMIGLGVELLESVLLPVVMNAVNTGVPSAWNATFDSLMESYGGVIPMTDLLSLDLSYADMPVVTSEHLQFFLNANLINTKTGKKAVTGSQPDMKIDTTSNTAIQFGLSAEALNSGSELLYESGLFSFEIPATVDPTDFNTSSFKDTIPQLEKLYGANKPIDMYFSMYQAPTVEFKDATWDADEMSLGKAYFDVRWEVEGKEAFTMRSSDAEFGFDLSIKDFKLTFQLEKIYIDKMTTINSNIGKPDPDFQAIANFIDIGADIAIAGINAMIPKIDIPKGIDSETQFQQLSLQDHDGYLYFEVGFEAAQALYKSL